MDFQETQYAIEACPILTQPNSTDLSVPGDLLLKVILLLNTGTDQQWAVLVTLRCPEDVNPDDEDSTYAPPKRRQLRPLPHGASTKNRININQFKFLQSVIATWWTLEFGGSSVIV
jgi:hypothetical protein